MHYLYGMVKLKLFIGVFVLFFALVTEAQNIDTIFTTSNSGISYNIVNTIDAGLNSSLFIGTEYGLTIYENDNWQVWREEESLLPENRIRTLYNDSKNQMWIGGFSNAPSFMVNDSLVSFSIPTELSNHVKDIIEFEQNGEQLLAMATESGLGIYNLTSKDWEIINFNSVYLISPNFTSLAYDDDIGLCAGTLNGGLVIVRNGDQVETYFGDGVIPDNTILDVEIDENNLIWLASPAAGLITYNGTSFENISPINSDIHSEFISCLWVVNSKEIWFGTNANGLGHLKDGEFSHYDSYNSGLLSDKINDLYLQNDSTLWLATDNGLAKFCVFDKNLSNLTFYNNENFIYPNPAVSKINIKKPYYDELTIYNVDGRVVFQTNGSIRQVEVSAFSAGVYYVAIKFNDLISVNKLNIL